MTNRANVKLGASGGEISNTTSGWKSIAGAMVGMGFLLAGVAVIRRLLSGDWVSARKAVITYIVALLIFIGVWALV